MTNTYYRILCACTALLAGNAAALADAGHGPTAFGKPGRAGQVDRTVKLSADGMSYGIEKLRVKEGATIRFVVRNRGEVNHDFTIGDAATQEAHRAEMAEVMKSSGTMDHDDANALFLKPGEKGKIIWTFSEAGRFEFACNVPGHYEAGMHGRIVVPDA